MNTLDRFLETARKAPQRIVLAEGEDPRVQEAAMLAHRDGIAMPILVGNRARIEAAIGKSQAGNLRIEDPASSPHSARFIERYHELRHAKGATRKDAETAICDPMGFAAMMVREGEADGMVGGAVATTAHTVRCALQIIGRARDAKLVSSFFLMMLNDPEQAKKGALLFADCGLVVEPGCDELADIAIASADSYARLCAHKPSIAMLSFSTMGSALHARVDKVRQATERVKQLRPDLAIDGELQFDAAFVPAINKAKAPGSTTGGDANVFVFPNLEAGNIGYKIAQRIGGATAIGPILQGLARPANDLSRGCSTEDVFAMIAITGVQAAAEVADYAGSGSSPACVSGT
ncbi:phosphate acetyltransferase [Aliihoeflea aestuarii]|jgi:phosphate acetyltransferase|uniref:phosphate acetyltransferase n=1 Tax=Aliihoeflea aestuarii TaxID=453840 RepID=UPI00209246E3|nr:phosphate acetyltransferase [Aliihoeflea aestuarii]MCO6390121.1 phosphate acetyltransferase [Aliihoeflea aestuarii]